MAVGSLGFRARLALWYTGTLSVLLLLFALQVYALARNSLLAEIDTPLRDDLAQIQWMIRSQPESFEAVAEQHPSLPYHTVSLRENHVHASEGWIQSGLDASLRGLPFDTPILWTNEAGDTFRVIKSTTPEDVRIAVARRADDVRVTLRSLALTLGIGIPSTLAFAALGGMLLAGRALRPVAAMANRARSITADRLSERLPVANPADEFGQLAVVFNETLARLEQSFEQLRRFTADASHQLRTPLAAIRATGEQGVTQQDAAALRETIGAMLEETDRLGRLVDDLLTITRAEGGQIPLRRERTDLALLAGGCVDALGVLAEEKGQSITTESEDGCLAEADPALLRQALLNLLDNAIKYTPAGGTVHVCTRRTGERVHVDIRDSGAGIPEDDRERVFERFVRLAGDAATGGSGLGLPVARWAVEVNGGTLRITESGPAGTVFRVEFPAAP